MMGPQARSTWHPQGWRGRKDPPLELSEGGPAHSWLQPGREQASIVLSHPFVGVRVATVSVPSTQRAKLRGPENVEEAGRPDRSVMGAGPPTLG